MAFDSARGVTVMHGGSVNSGYAVYYDTWEWDGNVWRQVSQTGPKLELGAEMAYDSNRGVCVLHGASDPLSPVMETWEWDGQAWTKVSTGGPSAKTVFAFNELTYDSARKVVVMNVLRETWEYDGNTWVLRSAGGPIGGSATFAFAYDSRRAKTVLFQGLDPANTAEWDGAKWSYPLRARPGYMEGPVFVYDESQGASIVVEWETPSDPAKTWGWDGDKWDVLEIGGPSPRSWYAMSYDSARHITTLFGGQTQSGNNGETWEFDGKVWRLVSSSGPAPRNWVAMAFDAARGLTVLYGGGGPGVQLGEVWEWDGLTWTKQGLSIIRLPSPAMAFDRNRNVLVLAGESYGRPSAFDTWEFDGQNWAFRSSMASIGDGSMVYDESRRACVFTVGRESWLWSGTDWVANPRSELGYDITRAAYDSSREKVVLLSLGTRDLTTILGYTCDCYADCNESGTLEVFDYLCYQEAFFRGDPKACNCDTSTGVSTCDIFDFLCFQSAFVGGCP